MPTDLLSALIVVASFSPPDCRADDVYRFPPADAAVACCKQCSRYNTMVNAIGWREEPLPLWASEMDAWRERRAARARSMMVVSADACWRFNCWDYLHGAWGLQGPYWAGVKSLRELRKLLGERDYLAGKMPEPAPIYFFPKP